MIMSRAMIGCVSWEDYMKKFWTIYLKYAPTHKNIWRESVKNTGTTVLSVLQEIVATPKFLKKMNCVYGNR